MHGWQSDPLMDRKVVGVVFFGLVAMVTPPQLLDIVLCSVVYL